MVINTTLVYYVIDPDLGVEIFFKKYGQPNKRELILKWGLKVPAAESVCFYAFNFKQ